MRLTVSLLTCIAVSVLAPALADPPASATPAASPAAPPAVASAAKPAAVNVEAAKMDELEKHFLAEGYKVEMHNNEKYFCRREETLGTRLGGAKTCSTAEQLQATEREAQAAIQRGQSQQNSPPNH